MNDYSRPEAESLVTSRRTIIKGAAWSVPVIAAAVVAPAYAASTDPVIDFPLGELITDWKGDHHYGSHNSNPSRRAYDLPIDVLDGLGNPISGAEVTVTVGGRNRDGDLLAVYAYPAPDNNGPESNPHPVATATTDGSGRAMFAVSTQNLSSRERPAEATLTVSVTVGGVTVTRVATVVMTESD